MFQLYIANVSSLAKGFNEDIIETYDLLNDGWLNSYRMFWEIGLNMVRFCFYDNVV